MSWFGIIAVIGMFFTMLGFCSNVDIQKVLSYLKRPKGIIVGITCQYVWLPIIAFSITRLMILNSIQSISIIMTSSCPGGALSNFWCWFFGLKLELSIAMTATSSVISFAFLSINSIIYIPLVADTDIKIDYISLAVSVVVLIAAVVIGLFISHKTDTSQTEQLEPAVHPIRKMLGCFGGACMICTLLLSGYQNAMVSAVPVYQLPIKTYLAAFALNFASWLYTYIVSYWICRMSKSESITVCFECSNQNVGLAIGMLLMSMEESDADIAVGFPMLYAVINALVICIVGSLLRCFGYIDDINDENGLSAFVKCIKCEGTHINNTNNNINNNMNLPNINDDDDVDYPLHIDIATVNNEMNTTENNTRVTLETVVSFSPSAETLFTRNK